MHGVHNGKQNVSCQCYFGEHTKTAEQHEDFTNVPVFLTQSLFDDYTTVHMCTNHIYTVSQKCPTFD